MSYLPIGLSMYSPVSISALQVALNPSGDITSTNVQAGVVQAYTLNKTAIATINTSILGLSDQVGGTLPSGLLTQITANSTSIDSLLNQTAGFTGSGLLDTITFNQAGVDALLSDYNAYVVSNDADIADLTSGLTALISSESTANAGLQTNIDAVASDLADLHFGSNQAGGVVSLNGSGKIPLALLPTGVMTLRGVYDASTALPPTDTPVNGDAWIVTVAGSYGGETYEVKDLVVYTDNAFNKITGSDIEVSTQVSHASYSDNTKTNVGTVLDDLDSRVGTINTLVTTNLNSENVAHDGYTAETNLKAVVNAIATRLDTNETDVADLQTLVTGHTADILQIQTDFVETTTLDNYYTATVVDGLITTQTNATSAVASDLTTLAGRVTAVEGDIADLPTTYYNKTEIDADLSNKADSTAVDSALALKQDIITPVSMQSIDLSIYTNNSVSSNGTLLWAGSQGTQYAKASVTRYGQLCRVHVSCLLQDSGSDYSTSTSNSISIVGLPAPLDVIVSPYDSLGEWVQIGMQSGGLSDAVATNSNTTDKKYIVLGNFNYTAGFRLALRDMNWNLITPSRLHANPSDSIKINFELTYLVA